MQTETLFDDAGLAPVADAIARMVATPEDPPTLETLAAELGYSHFTSSACSSAASRQPKRFAQALRLGPARALLTGDTPGPQRVARCRHVGPSRLHDLFVACEAVTPGDVRRRGRGLEIKWAYMRRPSAASCCRDADRRVLAVVSAPTRRSRRCSASCTRPMRKRLPARRRSDCQDRRRHLRSRSHAHLVDLHGTNFQIKVWQALLAIPAGNTVSYGELAGRIGNKAASRAVGTAVGSNPISLLIPCHRVIQASGAVHHYRWGTPTKRALLAWSVPVSTPPTRRKACTHPVSSTGHDWACAQPVGCAIDRPCPNIESRSPGRAATPRSTPNPIRTATSCVFPAA